MPKAIMENNYPLTNMKRITALRLFSIATAASASLFFTSCGEKKDGDGGADGDGNTQTEKKDTPDILTDEMITQMNAFADAMLSIKDKASAEEAIKKIDSIGDEIETLAGRFDKLETPSEAEKERLEEKMNNAEDALEKKMESSMPAIMSNPEVAGVLMPAMMKFGERMKKHDPVFERFGKKKDSE
jgi:hypothetical protein